MVRRWTRITNVTTLFSPLKWRLRIMNYRIFKRTTRFKKFVPLFSMRRRRQITRLKQATNFAIYLQILGKWILDYRDKRSIFRYQYMHSIAPRNFNGLNNMRVCKLTIFDEEDFYLQSSYMIAYRPFKLWKYLNVFSKLLVWGDKKKHLLYLETYLFIFDQLPSVEWVVNPLLSSHDTQRFLVNPEIKTFTDWFNWDLLILNVLLTKIQEIRKLLVLLYYLKS